jgi:hypothetical protein
MEDAHLNAPLDQLPSMELADAATESSKMVNVFQPAPLDGLTSMETANNATQAAANVLETPPLVLHASPDSCWTLSLELARSTETVNSVSSSQLNQAHAEESAPLDTHSKTHFVFLTVCPDSETMVSVVALLKESSLDVHSRTSSNKALACQPAMLDLSPTLPPEFVMHAHQTVSHACRLLSVPAAAQASISRTTFVSLVKDAPTTDSNTTVLASILAQLVPLFQMDSVKEDAIPTLSSWITSVTLLAQLDSLSELMLLVSPNAQLDTFLKDLSANCLSKPAHLDNSTTLKPVHVLHVLSPALNVNSLPLSVPLAPQDSPLPATDVQKLTAVDQEDSELLQDAQIAQSSVLTVSVPLNAQLALQVTFSTELTAF